MALSLGDCGLGRGAAAEGRGARVGVGELVPGLELGDITRELVLGEDWGSILNA